MLSKVWVRDTLWPLSWHTGKSIRNPVAPGALLNERVHLCSDCSLAGKILRSLLSLIPATFLSEEGDAQDVPGSELTESMLLH